METTKAQTMTGLRQYQVAFSTVLQFAFFKRAAVLFVRGGFVPNGVELASGKVAELVKSFEHVNEILDGFRYKMGAENRNVAYRNLANRAHRSAVRQL